jgi:hypothetical protein
MLEKFMPVIDTGCWAGATTGIMTESSCARVRRTTPVA